MVSAGRFLPSTKGTSGGLKRSSSALRGSADRRAGLSPLPYEAAISRRPVCAWVEEGAGTLPLGAYVAS